MALTNRQIDRYSRQIITPGFGGTAQQRLLDSHLVLAGDVADTAAVLDYLAGAGVGTIELSGAATARPGLAARIRDLNSDVSVRIADSVANVFDLALILGGSAQALLGALALRGIDRGFPAVLARLDTPAKIAVMPSSPPCLRCADGGGLLAPFGARAENAEFVAMLAALEALKLLAGYPSAPALISFNGYEASTSPLAASSASRCECGGRR